MSGERVVEKKILDLLTEDRLLSTSEIARKMKMRREITAGFLEALADQGKVKKMKVGRSNVYKPLTRIKEKTDR